MNTKPTFRPSYLATKGNIFAMVSDAVREASQTTSNPEEAINAVADNIFMPSNDPIADVVRWVNITDAAEDLRGSIETRLREYIKGANVPVADAIKDLRGQMKAAGIDKRRVSEVLIKLGFRERAASKAATDSAKEKSERLAPIVDELVRKAEELCAGDLEDMVASLRRAFLKAQGKKNGKDTSATAGNPDAPETAPIVEALPSGEEVELAAA